jgi:hypothetical protein
MLDDDLHTHNFCAEPADPLATLLDETLRRSLIDCDRCTARAQRATDVALLRTRHGAARNERGDGRGRVARVAVPQPSARAPAGEPAEHCLP